jgi:putative transposase
MAGTLKQKPGLPRYRKNKDGSRPYDYIPVKSARSYAVTHTVSIALPADLRSKGRLSMNPPHSVFSRCHSISGWEGNELAS